MKNINWKLFRKLRLSKILLQNFSNFGFTIVELLVVVTMVGLVAGVGIFSLVNYGNAQSLEQATGSIKSIFDAAKFNALSSVKIVTTHDGESIACENVRSYYVDVVMSSQDRVDLYMDCEDDEYLINSYSLPENLNLGQTTSCGEIFYESVTLEVGADPALPCDLSIEGFGDEKNITIDTLGNLSIN